MAIILSLQGCNVDFLIVDALSPLEVGQNVQNWIENAYLRYSL